MNIRAISVLVCAAVFSFSLSAGAYAPPVATGGPLTVEIQAADEVSALGTPVTVNVVLTSMASAPLTVYLEVWGTDDWRFEPGGLSRVDRTIMVNAGAMINVPFQTVAGPATYNAHYPINVRATFTDPATGREHRPQAVKVLIVHTANPAANTERADTPLAIEDGANSLMPLLTPLLENIQKPYWRQIPTVRIQAGDGGETRTLDDSWNGKDPEKDARFDHIQYATADKGAFMPCIKVRPAGQAGWDVVSFEYDLIPPERTPLTLSFSTATDGKGDGVGFTVLAASLSGDAPFRSEPPTDSFRQVFSRMDASALWEAATVDLSSFAGQRIVLRFVTGPGPDNDANGDMAYWSVVILTAGAGQEADTADGKARRYREALLAAEDARKGTPRPWSWTLAGEAGTFGAAVVPGPRGIGDAVIAITGSGGALVHEGFELALDDFDAFSLPFAVNGRWKSEFVDGRGVLSTVLSLHGKPTPVRIEVWAEKGTLRYRFSMPGMERGDGGMFRYTNIGLGRVISTLDGRGLVYELASSTMPAYTPGKAVRVYSGMGNVVENPGRFSVDEIAFSMATRHLGLDFPNGTSLVQASDIYPHQFLIDPDAGHYTLRTSHDATISLIPSDKGAFAAAKEYSRTVAGFKPSPAVSKLQGRMCLDYWGFDYRYGIDTVETLAKYGVTDCVFVWHGWQRYGYDVKLPDIYPALGSHADFVRLSETCARYGMLFCPHDNYIDFYPDAEGFTYDNILFNRDGSPQKAWYNGGRKILSYRWLPSAFLPFAKRNIELLRQDVKPTAYFTDVFTAVVPMDYHDRSGRYFPKTEARKYWAEFYDYAREALGGAPQIGECGHDWLVGHADAGQADHMSSETDHYMPGSEPTGGKPVTVRIPWHDIATHGSFILFGGGLGERYVSGMNPDHHGYGSDDYLSLTVLGGRNPIGRGESGAPTVRTYWLLHDICAELGRRPMNGHEFVADDIRHQRTVFGDDATVSVNRGEKDWTVDGMVLPPYGFTARTGAVRADISKRGGRVTSYAESPGIMFADARPPLDGTGSAGVDASGREVVDFGPVATNGAFRLVCGDGASTLTLLPGCPASEVRLNPSRIPGAAASEPKNIEKIDGDGRVVGTVRWQGRTDAVVFTTWPGDFGYRITWR